MGPDGTVRREVRFCVAPSRGRDAAQAQYRRHSRNSIGRAASVADGQVPGYCRGQRTRAAFVPWWAAIHMSHEPYISTALPCCGERDGAGFCGCPGHHRLANRQRADPGIVRPLLLQRLPDGLSNVVAFQIWQSGDDQHDLGDSLLEPELHRFRADSGALAVGRRSESRITLDYDRYQSFAEVSFQGAQLEMLRKLCPRHFITTNNVGLVDTINMRDLYADLDFVAFDNYPSFFEMLLHQENATITPDAIPTTIAFGHDFARSVKSGKPFMIMEEQSGKAGQRTFAPQPEKGQVRLWTYQAVAHGAMGVNYFRWDTATSGAEEYWHGTLNHDRSKSPAFDEMQQTVRELKALGPEVLHSKYVAEMALVFDYDCSWAVQIQPGHHTLSYFPQVTSWYGAMSASHSGIDIVAPEIDLAPYKIVFAPLAYVVSEAQAAKIRSYVQGGGVFVAGFRLGAKTESSQMTRTPLPGFLRDVMGVTVEDYAPIYSAKQGVKLSAALGGADGVADAGCGIWADILQPAGAEVLATYTAGAHAGKTAITSNKYGNGKAIYVGADLDAASLGKVLRNLAKSASVQQPLDVSPGVELTVRTSGAKKWTFLLNHTSEVQTVGLVTNFTDILTAEKLTARVSVGAYGVRILQAV